eukprot:CAMPEP_0197191948 /NCGR_PEP_ID=MMETSP1423-20130617/24286_1 /TAXON_ID=476441 /ORGANISM="Pseudo-nitzschia heimii, Strain UNC1101" /LENGTH=84 /DNA_ID=CAMNT_0042644743 /DNA_START=6 /DNA_END=257 /DNA_ORIENTATION=+
MTKTSGERKSDGENRRTRTKRSRLEKLLMLVVITVAVMIVVMDAFLLMAGTAIEESNDHHSVTNTHQRTNHLKTGVDVATRDNG